MINITQKDKCCGCHACYNICPRNAISMKEDNKGFKYPIIDEKKCIQCNLCSKVCPILKEKIVQKKAKQKSNAWCMYNKNEEERLNSSSGGIFILIAKEILSKNGVVFGASFDKEHNVGHSYIEDINDIYKLQGSKYVQSNIGDSYILAKKFLDNGREVLFTGTSCQIEGLYSFLNKNYENLYTQDIICHGVPSPKVWRKYIEYQKEKNKEKIKNIWFRNKDNGWAKFQTKISFETKTYTSNYRKDPYMNAFLYDVCLRDSCYNCKFKNKYRNSDITLADYWGINNINPKMNDNKGVSAVIINTEKGQKIFNLIKNNCIYEKTNIDDIIKYNSAYIKSPTVNKNTSFFFENLDKIKFNKLIKKVIPTTPLYKRVVRKILKTIKNNILNKFDI